MSSSSKNKDLETNNWSEIYQNLEKDYKEAYYSIDEAIKLDEEGKVNEALPLYEIGLNKIDEALEIPMIEPINPDITWEKALAMTQKLRKTRKEVVIRIENVKSKPIPTIVQPELPPSYEDAVAGSSAEEPGTSNNGNTSLLPGSSKIDVPYIPPSAVYDQELLANLNINGEENSASPMSYSALSQQLKEMKLAKNEEILFHCENVQLHFIAPDGRVSSTLEPNTLIIARIHDATSSLLDEALLSIVSSLSKEMSESKKRKHKHHHHSLLHKKRHSHRKNKHRHHHKKEEGVDESERTFLQVGSWVYPLIPEVSPCVRSEFGAFIFPDVNSNIEGAAVGVILPEEATEEVHELFTHLLNEATASGRSRRSILTTDGESSRIIRGAAYLAHNLIRGAGTTARFLDSSTPRLMNHLSPKPDPQPINPTVQKTVEVAKTVTGKAVDVTDYLATKISTATSALGRYLSPYIQKSGTKFLQSTVDMSEEEASQKINSVLNVTSDAVTGVSTIYGGLNTAASILARSLANNTVQIIEYKYGQPAGALTSDAITTFGNVYYTHNTLRALKPRGIARAAVRGAGAAILEDVRHKNVKPHEEFPGSGPGDGSGFSKN